MSLYPFEYFCGANVVVKIEDLPIMEIAGISYEVMESKRPLYGYSSRHFDGVARGQVLIEGTMIVNYVHQDYLFHAISLALERQKRDNPLRTGTGGQVADDLRRQGIASVANDYPESPRFIQSMRDRYWNNPAQAVSSIVNSTYNAHDLARGLDIQIVYGQQSDSRPSGRTGELLRGVYFKGRGKRIEIDENVIVEAYSFFARNVYSIRNPTAYSADKPAVEEGDTEDSTTTQIVSTPSVSDTVGP